MSILSDDSTKYVAVFINDFDQEFADGLEKLSAKLGRPLKGIILVDSTVKKNNKNVPDKNGVFEQLVCDFSSDTSLRATVKKFEANLLLVTCSSDRNQPFLQKLLPHVPYVLGPSESSLDWTTHKVLMRKMLTSYDDSFVPKVQPVQSYSEANIRIVLNSLTFPMIVKPTGLASSSLVSKVSTETDLRKALKHGFAVIKDMYKRYGGRGKPSFIIEEFIEGQMFSTDVYVNESGTVWPLPLLRVKTAHEAGKSGFYTYHTDTKHELTKNEINDGFTAAKKAVHALGLRSAVAHIELFLTPNGWKIIELGPRAGGERQDMYHLAYGVDHAYNELLVKIGLEPELNSELKSHAAKVHIIPEDEGEIMGFEGFDKVEKLASHSLIKAKVEVGQMALLSENGGSVVVAAVLHNTDFEQLSRDAESVRSLVKIITKKQAKND